MRHRRQSSALHALRARGFALNILIIHLFGDAVSPAVMGAIIGRENRYVLFSNKAGQKARLPVAW